MESFRPRVEAAHITKRLPTAPPVLYKPFAVAMACAVFDPYPSVPWGGKSKYSYHPGWPIVLPMIAEQYP